MGRLLLISGILFLVWIGFRFLKNSWSARVKDVDALEKKGHKQKQPQRVQQIKACAYCKTHIPEDEGIYQDGQFFCSYQHLDHYLEHKHNNK